MKKENKLLSDLSKLVAIAFAGIIVFSLSSWLLIKTSNTVANLGWPGFFETLFDYSRYLDGHQARLTGQIISNFVAYLFMFAAVLLFILSLALIKHDKSQKLKSALVALLLVVPTTVGLVGGFINFFGEGLSKLMGEDSMSTAIILSLIMLYFFDLLYLVMAVVYLVVSIKVAVKVNRGELSVEEEEEAVTGEESHEETAEEKLRKEEERAERRAQLLQDIRRIVREELERLGTLAVVKEEPEDEEEEEEEEEEEAPASAKAPRAPRIPFAKKLVKADKDLQEKYNEIKNEIMAYGASARLSISGDTFRLHRKPYVKITLVGKALKVYFALDPKDFVDSPIPVIDASDKNAYVEVPALLKVKSNLSVKRAKELVALAFEKDGIAREENPEEVNYMKEIRAELRKK